MHSEGCCLGFDFGLRKIGVAVGQFITFNAQPLGLIKATDGLPDWHEIKKMIHEWRPKCLVVGLPIAVDGSDLSITEKAKWFAFELEQFGLPVYLSDERLTTKEAKSHLFQFGGYKALQNGQVDKLAAALLLEQWMNEHI
jgi:putative Holliday junction resolvase